MLFHSPLPPVKVPNVSYHEFMLQRLQAHPPHQLAFVSSDLGFLDRLLLQIDEVDGRPWTYGQLLVCTQQVYNVLQTHGVHETDVLLLCVPNCAYFLACALACSMLGAVFSMIHVNSASGDIKYQTKDSGAKFMIAHADVLDKCRVANDKLRLPIFVVPGNTSNVKLTLTSSEYPLASSSTPSLGPMPKGVSTYPNQLLALPYSSGTTGLPKGVMLSQYAMVASITLFLNMLLPDHTSPLCAMLPFSHMFGFLVMSMCARRAVPLVCLPKYHPRSLLQIIQQHKTKILYCAPPVMVMLAKSPLVDKYDISALTYINCGAAPLSEALITGLYDRLPKLKQIGQGYGMTEFNGIASSPSEQLARSDKAITAAGVVTANSTLKVLDVTTGKLLGPNEKGEICCRGEHIMLGYLNRPEATRETIEQDGFMHTGDIGYVDERGYVFVVDRLKELIKVKGHQVPPAELENLLLKHECIADAAVIGVADEYAGEVPMAFVLLKPDKHSSQHDIQLYVKEKVAPYKQLTGGVRFVNSVPRSANGKILRNQLRKQMAEEQKTKAKL